jgi:hypothetical protein
MIKVLFAIEQLYYDSDDTLSKPQEKKFFVESNTHELFVFFMPFNSVSISYFQAAIMI